MFSDILQAQDYYTAIPEVRDAIDEEIRREINNFGTDLDMPRTKKGKTSH